MPSIADTVALYPTEGPNRGDWKNCAECGGEGQVEEIGGEWDERRLMPCDACGGTGESNYAPSDPPDEF